MVKLEKGSYDPIYRLYQSWQYFYPLIAAVLLDEQDGVVYVDDADQPTHAYVEHAFGFAQIFGARVDKFEQELKQYLLHDQPFTPAKVRLYTPHLPDYLMSPEYESLRSERQRFHITAEDFSRVRSADNAVSSDISFDSADASNIALIEKKFGVVNRFWRTPEDFIRKAHTVVVMYQGQMASICYAAAEGDKRVEIDVMTLPDFRNLGLGKHAVMEFVERCLAQSLQPLWDCFTNNSGSMMLCKSTGFVAAHAPYPFFTINKPSPEKSG